MIACPPLLGVTNKPGNADAHWRLVRPFHHLREQGIDAVICGTGDDGLPTVSPEGRVVVLQRTIKQADGPEPARAWVQSLRDAGALAVVFEIDDDEISGAAGAHLEQCGVGAAQLARRETERQWLLWTMQACDAVTASTDPLAEIARRYTDRPVTVIPNAIDPWWFRKHLAYPAAWADHLTIGWAGYRRPEADLEPMAVAWGRIARRYPDVRFVVAGHQPECVYREVEDIDRIIRVPWTANLDGYPRAYQVDIGCVAVADSPFSRCKSPIKLWEYGAAGAAVVASPTVYMDEVAHGANGWLAETAGEWEIYLSALIENESLRGYLAAGLLAHVAQEHSLPSQTYRWADAYTGILKGVGVRA